MQWILGITEFKPENTRFLRLRLVNVSIVERLNFEDFHGVERAHITVPSRQAPNGNLSNQATRNFFWGGHYSGITDSSNFRAVCLYTMKF